MGYKSNYATDFGLLPDDVEFIGSERKPPIVLGEMLSAAAAEFMRIKFP